MLHEHQNDAVLDQFGKQAQAYAALVKGRADSLLPALLETSRPVPDDVMLDVGCGTGKSVLALATLVRHATGIDLTPEMLDQARKAQADAGVANVEWRQGDVTNLPFADGSFSLVTSRNMLHHVASPGAVISEMRRVCAPGGRVVVTDLTPAPAKGAAFDAIEILRDPSHVHALLADELRAIGAELGLTEMAVRSAEARFPLESVLATSFPAEGMLDRVRRLYHHDAVTGADSLGMSASLEDGELRVSYPQTLVVWRR